MSKQQRSQQKSHSRDVSVCGQVPSANHSVPPGVDRDFVGLLYQRRGGEHGCGRGPELLHEDIYSSYRGAKYNNVSCLLIRCFRIDSFSRHLSTLIH
jgi:hypothetical protein